MCTCTCAGHETACNRPSNKLATDSPSPSWHKLLSCLVSFPNPLSKVESILICYQMNSWREVDHLESRKLFWHFRLFLGWSLMFTGDTKIKHLLFLSNKLRRGSCRGGTDILPADTTPYCSNDGCLAWAWGCLFSVLGMIEQTLQLCFVGVGSTELWNGNIKDSILSFNEILYVLRLPVNEKFQHRGNIKWTLKFLRPA